MEFKKYIIGFWVVSLATTVSAHVENLSALDFSKRGIQFNFTRNLQMRMSGYADVDAIRFSKNPLDANSDISLRRAKLTQALLYGQNWAAVISEDWQDKSLEIDSAYLGYSRQGFSVALGQASPDFGLNNTADYQAMPFPEYTLPSYAFSPTYAIGIFPNFNNRHWVFQASFNTFRIATKYRGHVPYNVTLRTFYAPYHSDGHVLHLGASFWQAYPDGANTVEIGTIPEATNANFPEFVDTGTMNSVLHAQVGDLEFAYENNALNVMSEYMFNNVSRGGGRPSLWFDGYYVSATYFLTGEHRLYLYPAGYFFTPSKIHHRYGAFQLATRFSHINLNSHDIRGGDEYNATLGLNWYFTQRIDCKFDFIHVWNRTPTTHRRAQFNIALIRLEAGFYG